MTAAELKYYLKYVPDDAIISYRDGQTDNSDVEIFSINKGRFTLSPKGYEMTDQEIFNHNMFELNKATIDYDR